MGNFELHSTLKVTAKAGFIALISGALLSLNASFAATIDWDDGGTGSEITTVENWVGDVAPGTTDTANFVSGSTATHNQTGVTETYQYIRTGGSNTSLTISDGTVQTTGTGAGIIISGTSNNQIIIDGGTLDVDNGQFRIGGSPSQTDNELVLSSGTLDAANQLSVGYNSSGNTFTMTGGTADINSSFKVGQSNSSGGSDNTANISGGTINNTGSIGVGSSGSGSVLDNNVLNASGTAVINTRAIIIGGEQGTNSRMTVADSADVNASDNIVVGQGSSSDSTLTINGGTISTEDQLLVGASATTSDNALNVTAGTLDVGTDGTGDLIVGSTAGSTGSTLDQSGGTINAHNNFYAGLDADDTITSVVGGTLNVGIADGSGDLIVGGGTGDNALFTSGFTADINVEDNFSVVGEKAYTWLGGNTVDVGGSFIVGGANADSWLTIYDVTANADANLIIGNDASSVRATTQLLSGSLSVDSVQIDGAGGTDSGLRARGGTLIVRSGDIEVGDHSAATGSGLSVTGGDIDIQTGDLIVGSDGGGTGAAGSMYINRGTIDINDSLTLGAVSGSDGTATHGGGTVLVGTGGTDNDLLIGAVAGASGSYTITEGTLTVTDDIQVGTQAGDQTAASFTVSGTGTVDIDAADLFVEDNATFTLANANAAVDVSGEFEIDAGSTFNQDVFTLVTTDIFTLDTVNAFTESTLLSLDGGWAAADVNGFIPLVTYTTFNNTTAPDPVGTFVTSPNQKVYYQVVINDAGDTLGLEVISHVPEPSSVVLLGFGTALLLLHRRRIGSKLELEA